MKKNNKIDQIETCSLRDSTQKKQALEYKANEKYKLHHTNLRNMKHSIRMQSQKLWAELPNTWKTWQGCIDDVKQW